LVLIITSILFTGGKTYKYDKKRKIPLLEDILNVTSKSDVLHYLEVYLMTSFFHLHSKNGKGRGHEVRLNQKPFFL